MAMHISVRLAEPYWRSVGQKELAVETSESTQVGDLLTFLRVRYPRLNHEIEQAAPTVFVDDHEVDTATALTENCCVHLVWPVAGG